MKTIRLMSAVVVTAAVCAWSAVAPAQQPRLNVRYGQGFQGTVSRNHVSGQFRNENGHSGHMQYRPGNVQGGYRAPDGSNATARITTNSGQFGYCNSQGNGYSGGYSNQNGATAVHGGYRTTDGYSYGGGVAVSRSGHIDRIGQQILDQPRRRSGQMRLPGGNSGAKTKREIWR